MSMQLFDRTCYDLSRKVALNYSTSFSLGIRLLGREYRDAVFAIYGFVRIADEIVDTFYQTNQRELLYNFRNETYVALKEKISTNPILHAFQHTANAYGIDASLIDPFFVSMADDLTESTHSNQSYDTYIYGSAEVVGLMCLKVFCQGNIEQYNALMPAARSLGAAFQKVNFLRDMQSDFEERGRVYFPGVDFQNFSDENKLKIIADIKLDFQKAYAGIVQLPVGCRLGVYTAYIYYLELLEKIERTTAKDILNARIRIPNGQKITLLLKSYFMEKMMSSATM